MPEIWSLAMINAGNKSENNAWKNTGNNGENDYRIMLEIMLGILKIMLQRNLGIILVTRTS